MHLVALSLWVADCWRRLNFSIAMVYISCRKLSWSPTALIDSCLCFTSVIQCMHGDDISLAYISLYYWLILNSTSNLSVHVFAARLYAGSRILLGKLDRYLPKTINDDLVVAVLIAISIIANKPGFIWKKKSVVPQCVGLHRSNGRALQRYPPWIRILLKSRIYRVNL